MNYRILIVEDEEKLREVLSDFFESKQDIPFTAANGIKALELAESQEFDAVLLDIMMPGLDGFAVCKRLRTDNDVPLVFMTALADEEDKLYGYELGADDYITKPFSMAVLYAKVTALIKRRRGNILSADILEAGGITIRLSTRQVFAGNKEVVLTPKEYSLLKCLIENRNLIMSREQLLIKCWGYDFEGEARVVDTQIKRLRVKLGESYSGAIRTIIKAGYKFEA